MADELFGWDLLYRSVENELRKKEDLVIALTHWFIIKNGFICIGNGNWKTLGENEVESETLAPGWNHLEDYNIRYLHGDKLYLLRASVVGGDIILNFLRAGDLCISSCILNVDDTVKDLRGKINTIMPDYKNVLSLLRKELIDPVFVNTTHLAAGTQTSEETNFNSNSQRTDPYSPNVRDGVNFPRAPLPRRPHPLEDFEHICDPLRDPRVVGRLDLDPFSQGVGGGMLYDPLNPRINRNLDPVGPGPSHGLPSAAVPPGARFDPFGPPGTGRSGSGSRRIEPDPDHLPPPGYDDMFINDGPPDSTFDPQNPRRGRGRGRGGTDPNQPSPPGNNDPYM